jgi:hypothetical protein
MQANPVANKIALTFILVSTIACGKLPMQLSNEDVKPRKLVYFAPYNNNKQSFIKAISLAKNNPIDSSYVNRRYYYYAVAKINSEKGLYNVTEFNHSGPIMLLIDKNLIHHVGIGQDEASIKDSLMYTIDRYHFSFSKKEKAALAKAISK